jgi:maleate cis-trans isomerase
MKTLYRIGQIVPSSNITMETEIPAMLQARQLIRPERFAFHSSRVSTKYRCHSFCHLEMSLRLGRAAGGRAAPA